MRDKTTNVDPFDTDDPVYPDEISDDPTDPFDSGPDPFEFDEFDEFDALDNLDDLDAIEDIDDTGPSRDVVTRDVVKTAPRRSRGTTRDAADSANEPASETTSVARSFFDWAVVVVVALVVALLIRTFLLAHFVVDGTSMYSTLHDHDRVFVNKLSYDLHDPNRGDVVVLHERSGDRDLIKRVIALPGETIEMSNCEVRIDGRVLNEPYLDPTVVTPGNCGPDQPALLVPAGNVFVMGDNRPGSQDSRYLGPISYDDVVGRAFVVFWPRADWQWL